MYRIRSAKGMAGKHHAQTRRHYSRLLLVVFIGLCLMAGTTACGKKEKPVTAGATVATQPSTTTTAKPGAKAAVKPSTKSACTKCATTQPVPPRASLDPTVTEKAPAVDPKVTETAPETTASASRTRSLSWLTKADTPRLALIIDDWGQQKSIEDDFLEMDIPLTVAVIPFLARSATDAGLATAAGFDVLLHLPMEPEDASLANIKGIVTTAMKDDEIKSAVAAALANVPSALGVNNHMGSKATSDKRVMRLVLDELDKTQLFFLDSKTTANTVAAGIGDATGVPVLERNVFLDGSSDISYIHGQLLAAAHLAKDKGYAIAIGHVRPNTAQALREGLAEIEKLGVRLVRVSELVQAEAAGAAGAGGAGAGDGDGSAGAGAAGAGAAGLSTK